MARAVALRPLVFQHVPKTAGVSLRSVISSNFHALEILHVPDARWKDARFAARAVRRYRFIHGHLHYEFLRGIIRTSDAITFLRDPVERVLSLYFFLRAQPLSPDASPGARLAIEQAKNHSVEEFIVHPDQLVASMISNYQVQMYLTETQIEQSDRTWVATALANLEAYRFVGIADPGLMSKSVDTLTRLFGWVPSGDPPRVNHISRPASSGQLVGARRAIAERNELDLEFYARVRAQLPARLGLRGARLARARAVARTQLQRYRTGLMSPVTMDQPLRGWGWYDRDQGAAKDCWRGAAQLRVGLELRLPAESPLLLVLALRSVHPRVAITDTVFEAQGQTLPSAAFTKDERPALALLVKRKHIGRDGILSLVISCKETESGAIAAAAVPNRRFVAFMLETIEVISGEGLGAMPLFEQLLTERPHLQAQSLGLAAERSGRRAEQAQAAAYTAALTERAERAEAYSTSLAGELRKLQDETRALAAARSTEQVSAARHSAELQQSVSRSQTFAASLAEELGRQQAENRAVTAARETERAAAEKHHAALTDRAERSETYCTSLQAEIARLRNEVESGRTYCASLQAEVEKLRNDLQVAHTYSDSLQTELANVRDQNQALTALREHERIATGSPPESAPALQPEGTTNESA